MFLPRYFFKMKIENWKNKIDISKIYLNTLTIRLSLSLSLWVHFRRNIIIFSCHDINIRRKLPGLCMKLADKTSLRFKIWLSIPTPQLFCLQQPSASRFHKALDKLGFYYLPSIISRTAKLLRIITSGSGSKCSSPNVHIHCHTDPLWF